MAAFRRLRARLDAKQDWLRRSLEASRATQIALCFERLYTEDMPASDAAVGMILDAAGEDRNGLEDFTDELRKEAATTDDERYRSVAALFTLAVGRFDDPR